MSIISLSKDTQKIIIAEYLSGDSVEKVANTTGVNSGMVYKTLVENKVPRRPIRKWTMDQNFFEKIDSHEKAQILGFYWADGCLVDAKNKDEMSRLSLGLSIKDLDYTEWIAGQFKSTYPIQKYHNKKNGRDYIRLAISDPKPVADIQKLGIFPRKSLVIGFPTTEQVPEEFLCSFVLGVFEGDGCIHLKKDGNGAMAQFAATINFNKYLQEILQKIGIHSSIDYPKYAIGKNFCKLEITRVDSIFKLMDWMYAGTSYRMERKWLKFKEFRARYDKNGNFIETEEWKSERKAKLKAVRDSWTLSADSRKKMSETHAKNVKKSFVSFTIKAPDGTIYYSNTISDFAREMGVNVGSFHQFVRKRNTVRYKGWTHPTEEEIVTARTAGKIIEKIYRQGV